MPDGDIDVFISYKKEEADKAQRLFEALEAAGYSAVYDATGLNLNENFADKLESLIRRARRVVVLWTEMSSASDWVRDEARLARDLDKYLGVVVEPNTDIALDLRNLHKIDLTRMTFDEGVDVIVKEIAGQLGLGSLTPAALAEASFFRAVEAGGSRGGYEAFLGAHPGGRYAERARGNLAALPKRWSVPLLAAIAVAAVMGTGGYFAGGYFGQKAVEATQVVSLTNELKLAASSRDAAVDGLNADLERLKQQRDSAIKADAAARAALTKAQARVVELEAQTASLGDERAKPDCWKGSKAGIEILGECRPLSTAILSLKDPLFTDASPLSGLISLQRLFLTGTKVTDVSPLSGLTKLERLSLAATPITNLAPLRPLINLHYLATSDGKLIGSATNTPESRKAVADYLAAHSK